jgi:hypothetical protein
VFTSNPCGGGVVDITASIVAGPPLGGYFMVITLNQGAFPNGSFFGLEPFLAEVVSQAQTPGFVGALNGAGAFTLGPICGLPPGFFTFYGVALAFATPTIDFPINATTPETISP